LRNAAKRGGLSNKSLLPTPREEKALERSISIRQTGPLSLLLPWWFSLGPVFLSQPIFGAGYLCHAHDVEILHLIILVRYAQATSDSLFSTLTRIQKDVSSLAGYNSSDKG